jgi:hypothetical protein
MKQTAGAEAGMAAISANRCPTSEARCASDGDGTEASLMIASDDMFSIQQELHAGTGVFEERLHGQDKMQQGEMRPTYRQERGLQA